MRTIVGLVWVMAGWLASGSVLAADATDASAIPAAGAHVAPVATAVSDAPAVAAPVVAADPDVPAAAAAPPAVTPTAPPVVAIPPPAPSPPVSSTTGAGSTGDYRLQPGDILAVSVWKEPELTGDVLVRPDGGISLPLTGEIDAAGRTGEEVRSIISERLVKYIPSPAVAVSVKQALGNQIFVLGKVNRPGQFPMNRPMDVMQAISLAGGTTPFAALNDIHVLRRDGQHETAIKFRYADVERGRNLAQNIVLRSGDTVVVP